MEKRYDLLVNRLKYKNYTHICVFIFSIHTCIRVHEYFISFK